MSKNVKMCVLFLFFAKYTATQEQVTRIAPTREPDDTKSPYVNARENKLSMSGHSQLGREANLKKTMKMGGGACKLD